MRLVILLLVFFVIPWLLGVLSPGDAAPRVSLPGAGGAVSLDGLGVLLAEPGLAMALGVGVAAAGALWLAWITRAALRRGTRAQLAMVTAPEPRADRRRRRGRAGRR